MIGVKYWAISLGLMALLAASAIWLGFDGYVFLVILAFPAFWYLRREHRIDRAIKDAEDHPPDDEGQPADDLPNEPA